MKNLLEKLRAFRHEMWRALTQDDASHAAHWLLVFFGSLVPAAIAAAFWGLTVGQVVGFVFSELWLLFMSGREVVDWLKHRATGDKPGYKRDGVGDLVGPVVNHLIWWLAILYLIFGG